MALGIVPFWGIVWANRLLLGYVFLVFLRRSERGGGTTPIFAHAAPFSDLSRRVFTMYVVQPPICGIFLMQRPVAPDPSRRVSLRG